MGVSLMKAAPMPHMPAAVCMRFRPNAPINMAAGTPNPVLEHGKAVCGCGYLAVAVNWWLSCYCHAVADIAVGVHCWRLFLQLVFVYFGVILG